MGVIENQLRKSRKSRCQDYAAFYGIKKVSSVAEVHIPYTNIVRGTHIVPYSTTIVVWAIIACLPYNDGKNWRQASTKAKKLKRHDAGDDA